MGRGRERCFPATLNEGEPYKDIYSWEHPWVHWGLRVSHMLPEMGVARGNVKDRAVGSLRSSVQFSLSRPAFPLVLAGSRDTNIRLVTGPNPPSAQKILEEARHVFPSISERRVFGGIFSCPGVALGPTKGAETEASWWDRPVSGGEHTDQLFLGSRARERTVSGDRAQALSGAFAVAETVPCPRVLGDPGAAPGLPPGGPGQMAVSLEKPVLPSCYGAGNPWILGFLSFQDHYELITGVTSS